MANHYISLSHSILFVVAFSMVACATQVYLQVLKSAFFKNVSRVYVYIAGVCAA